MVWADHAEQKRLCHRSSSDSHGKVNSSERVNSLEKPMTSLSILGETRGLAGEHIGSLEACSMDDND